MRTRLRQALGYSIIFQITHLCTYASMHLCIYAPMHLLNSMLTQSEMEDAYRDRRASKPTSDTQ